MESKQARFDHDLAVGVGGEVTIAAYLRSRGASVLPVYEVQKDSFAGPRLFTPRAGLVAPDLLVFKGTKIFWVEAKTKSRFSWHRKTSTWQTGIDRHHWRDYLEIRKQFLHPVWLLFLHTDDRPSKEDLKAGSNSSCPVGLFGKEVMDLYLSIDHEHKNHGKHGMVYWAVESLQRLPE